MSRSMVGKSLWTLSCCVLLYFSTQIEIAHTPAVYAPTISDEQHTTRLPPRSHQAIREGASNLISPDESKRFHDVLALAWNLPPIKFISLSHKIHDFLGMPLVQQNCLTTAVYFEARSEPVLGQLAVATVILNRVKSSKSSICGVVYKGANQFNACQFSFACDGKPDVVDDANAWREVLKLSKLAVANDNKTYSVVLDNLATATNYHADYVDPRWSKSLTRLAKIGRHIFYSQGPTVEAGASRKNYI
jgi:hypothetical protein